MDGGQATLSNSLQFRLTLWLSVAILLLSILVGAVSFWVAFEQAHELQDDTLRQIATLFEQSHLPIPQSRQSMHWDIDTAEDSNVLVQQLATTPLAVPSTLGPSDPPMFQFASDTPDGLYAKSSGSETYQVLIRTLSNQQRLMVAQNTNLRDQIALNSVMRSFVPFLALMPLLLLMIPLLVRRLLRPLNDAAQEVDQRDEHDFSPILIQPLVNDVRPFVLAINQLLGRTRDAMDAQRRFVADAAHELRSPLTALSIQAEYLSACALPVVANQRVVVLRQGIDRAKTLLEQLLALAHAQSTSERSVDRCSVQQTYRQVLEDLMPLAEQKSIDIGVMNDLDAHVSVNGMDLFKMIRNLADNAIRYTPVGGRIDLSIEQDARRVGLTIEDNGIGLDPTEYRRVFDPFYRVLGSGETGSGLGLSIVNAIALKYHALVELSVAKNAPTGLRVTIWFQRDP